MYDNKVGNWHKHEGGGEKYVLISLQQKCN